MTLEQMLEYGHLRRHRTSAQEVKNLLAIVERDLRDSRTPGLSADARFAVTYNVGLKLCTILLFASGFRTGQGDSHHYRTIEAMPVILGPSPTKNAEYFNGCRNRRHKIEYDCAGVAGDNDVADLQEFVAELKSTTMGWLQKNQPELLQFNK